MTNQYFIDESGIYKIENIFTENGLLYDKKLVMLSDSSNGMPNGYAYHDKGSYSESVFLGKVNKLNMRGWI